MQKSIPFEYGVLYRNMKESRDIDLKYHTNVLNSVDCYPYVDMEQQEEGFEPVAFLEKEQIVIGNVFAKEYTPINAPVNQNTCGTQYGLSFQYVDYVQLKKFRVRIPVKEFIENYEKIL